MPLKFINKDAGFAALFITVISLAIMLGIAFSITTLALGSQRTSTNIVKSTQSYYAAEAGLEDALLRLKQNPTLSPLSYNLNVGQGAGNVDISNIIGGSRVITSQGDVLNRVRKIQVVYAIKTDVISFHYGAQVGDGGMEMGNGSIVQGNIFSNSSVIGGGTVQNSIIVARNGNRIQGLYVGENAKVYTCQSSTINGNLTYDANGSSNCTVHGTTTTQTSEIQPEALPISQNQIDEWKAGAVAGGVITTDVSISDIKTLGPVQIGTPANPKNLFVGNGAVLIVKGTIYLTGNITFSNGALIKLDSSYGSLSGVILADGVITVENNVLLDGSGQPGSYILILSTKNDAVNPVVDIRNNTAGKAIYYANSGLIYLKNNMLAREVTGYKIQIENNAIIQYESGLQNANFTSGPGGSWQVESWKETD